VAVIITAAGVGDADGGGRNGDSHALQHVRETLGGEERLTLIAGARESDHQAVPDQLVFADAFDGDQIFETRAVRGLR